MRFKHIHESSCGSHRKKKAKKSNESLQALAQHVKKGVPLCDRIFRYQSDAYFDTFRQAKQLREMGALPELDWESEEMLGLDIGEQVTLENGETVWLDVPYLIEREAPDLSDDMIGSPDTYYDEQERREAYNELKDAMDRCGRDWERESVIDGICPNCAGTGYQDGDEPEYDDEGEEIEGSAYECDGWSNYGCDQGEMTGAEWVDIIKHDERVSDREKAKANYPGDEEVVNQIVSYAKHMDDPRQAYQQVAIDYPHLGRAQRSSLVAKAMKMAFPEVAEMRRLAGLPLLGEGVDSPVHKLDTLISIDHLKDCGLCKGGGMDANDMGIPSGMNKRGDAICPSCNGFGKLGVIDWVKSLMPLHKQSTIEWLKDNFPNSFDPAEGDRAVSDEMFEAEYNGKKVQLNKPKRGGSKKYYVYVKNPKTDRVKKIEFGDSGGLTAKTKDPARVRSFVARHKCKQKNDKTKAGYWACRLPRYAKSLGLSGGGTWW